MKKLIYFPLLALIILTGCKGNSFMTQRYTQFGHSSHKKGFQEKIVVTDSEKSITVAIEKAILKESEDALICSANPVKNSAAHQPQFSVFKVKRIEETGSINRFKGNSTMGTANNKIHKSKKTYHERLFATKNILDSVLGIVVTIVVLVVVIVLVLILVAAIL